MGRNTKRLLILVGSCSALGVILGGTASQAAINECLTDETPAATCLTQDPTTQLTAGMMQGLVMGAGAAAGAGWRLWQK